MSEKSGRRYKDYAGIVTVAALGGVCIAFGTLVLMRAVQEQSLDGPLGVVLVAIGGILIALSYHFDGNH